MSRQAKSLYEFGPFRLIPDESLLLRGDRPVALAPKDFEVLAALVCRSGSLVGKEELLKEVWPDSFVEEANSGRHRRLQSTHSSLLIRRIGPEIFRRAG